MGCYLFRFLSHDSSLVIVFSVHVKHSIIPNQANAFGSYPHSKLSGARHILKDAQTETLIVGMEEGEYCCLSGSYLFQVLKGCVDALGMAL